MLGSKQMLDAHVRFEVDRLTGAGLEQTARAEVGALFDWLGTVRVADVLPDATEAADVVVGILEALPSDERASEILADAVVSVHRALLAEDRPVADLVRYQDYDGLVEVLVSMGDVRRELLDVLTTSDAYTGLVAHVLYHGLKRYVLTENVLARRIPGAQSLVRLGQRGLTSAAPKLEGQVDRQLLAFVQANIGDTLRESQRYLDTMLDDELLSAMARETWQEHSGRATASVAGLVSSEQLADLTRLAVATWGQLRAAGLVQRVARTLVTDLLERHGGRVVRELLEELGVDEGRAAEQAVAALRPALDHARETGFLEARIRARLEPFYAQYAEHPPTTP